MPILGKQENDDAELSANDRRAIRSFRKLIDAHERKLEEFRARPTIRPGMEQMPLDRIQAQQEARERRLIREIRKFEKEIASRRKNAGKQKMNKCELSIFPDGVLPDWAEIKKTRTICLMDSVSLVEAIVPGAVRIGAFAFVCCGEEANALEDAVDEVLERAEENFDIMTTAHVGQSIDDIAFFIAVALGAEEPFRVLAFVQSDDEQALAICAALKDYVAVPV